MDTMQIKGSFKRVNRFLKKGRQLLGNKIDNKIIISYYNCLISIKNKENTICEKLRFIYLLEQCLISKKQNF